MPRGCGVVRYAGRRGVVWRIKWRDADGRDVQETLGSEADGWTRKRAEEELRARLTDVRRDGLLRPDRVLFADFAEEQFLSEYIPGRGLKHSTVIHYQGDVRLHLIPFFGGFTLAEIDQRGPELIDRFISHQTARKLSQKTVRNQIIVLGLVLKLARRWKLIRTNPVADVDKPRVVDGEMNVLTEADIAALLAAYRELEQAADDTERPWWGIARRLVTVALGTAMRRGELLALRWGDVSFVDGLLRVERQWVRNQMTTPKSRTSRRTIELGPTTRAALEQQWKATVYQADGDVVFSHPLLGTPLDPSKLSRDYMRPALAKAGITKPFRVWHDMRHTALTHEAAAGNPQAYVQWKAGHSQGTITERYIHAAQVLFPGAAAKAEQRLFGAVDAESG